jgi:hypothetical protein
MSNDRQLFAGSEMKLKVKAGQVVYVNASIRNGMFPDENYFRVSINPPIAGYVTRDHVFQNTVRGVVVDVFKDGALVALPGELSRNNVVRVPLSMLQPAQT